MLSYYVSIQGNIIDLTQKNLDIVCSQIMNPKINLGNSVLITEKTPLRAIKKAVKQLIPFDRPLFVYGFVKNEKTNNSWIYIFNTKTETTNFFIQVFRNKKPTTLRIKRKSLNDEMKEAEFIGNQLGITWDKFNVDQFRRGIKVELEHGLVDQKTNVTNDDLLITAKIALAHLNEFPDYYDRLEKMEKEGEKYWSK